MVRVARLRKATYVGGLSDSSRAKTSGGNSSSLKACWSWLAPKGMDSES